jgi:hypothetical protein
LRGQQRQRVKVGGPQHTAELTNKAMSLQFNCCSLQECVVFVYVRRALDLLQDFVLSATQCVFQIVKIPKNHLCRVSKLIS